MLFKKKKSIKKILLKKIINIIVNPIYSYIITLIWFKIRNIIIQKINNVFYLIALIILQFRNVHNCLLFKNFKHNSNVESIYNL